MKNQSPGYMEHEFDALVFETKREAKMMEIKKKTSTVKTTKKVNT